MKRRAVCFLLCLCFCFYSVSLSCFAGSSFSEEIISDEILALSVDEYAVSTLATTSTYNFIGCGSFGITDTMMSNSSFLFHEDLPYGKDTAIIGLRYASSSWLLLILVNGADSSCTIYQMLQSSGKPRIQVLSLSPIYTVAFNNQGDFVSWGGYDKVTAVHNDTVTSGDMTLYSFRRNLNADNVNFTLSDNKYLDYYDLYQVVDDEYLDTASFSFDTYPTRSYFNSQLQVEQNKTSNNIWETLKSVLEYIKNLPSNIANSIKGFFTDLGDRISGFFEKLVEDIKGLFIPSDGYFDTYQAEFQTYFKERFGLLYEIPELVISLFTKILNFNPQESGYMITFPAIEIPVLHEDGVWRTERLSGPKDFTFSFILNTEPFNLFYDIYISIIWLIYILLLINLIKNKANSVFKGG